MVGIYPNEAAIRYLVGALLLEQHDEWAVQRRYMPLETISPMGDVPPPGCPQRRPDERPSPPWAAEAWRSYTTPRGMTDK